MTMKRFALLLAAILPACTTSQLRADGQLFCEKASADGPIVFALATAIGAPVIVTDALSSVVADACALSQAIPVSPPAFAVPTVAVPLTNGNLASK